MFVPKQGYNSKLLAQSQFVSGVFIQTTKQYGRISALTGGLEVYYPNCSETVVKFYKNLAKKYQILATGGSDAHGKAKTHTYVGKTQIPYELVEELKSKFKI